MKNKRLLIIFSILCVLVLIVVLNSTVFAFSSAEIVFLDNCTLYSNNSIIESADFVVGTNIFVINKNSHINKIQSQYPYVRVVNIETIFPNKLKINAVQRKELFAVELSGGGYSVVDDQLFVVKTQTGSYVNSATNAIIINGFEKPNARHAGVAQDLMIDEKNIILFKTLAYVLQEWTSDFATMFDKIKSITINYERENLLKIDMRSGVQIHILESQLYLSNKFQLAMSTYNTTTDKDGNAVDYKTSGIIEIRTDVDGNIYGVYVAEE